MTTESDRWQEMGPENILCYKPVLQTFLPPTALQSTWREIVKLLRASAMTDHWIARCQQPKAPVTMLGSLAKRANLQAVSLFWQAINRTSQLYDNAKVRYGCIGFATDSQPWYYSPWPWRYERRARQFPSVISTQSTKVPTTFFRRFLINITLGTSVRIPRNTKPKTQIKTQRKDRSKP